MSIELVDAPIWSAATQKDRGMEGVDGQAMLGHMFSS